MRKENKKNKGFSLVELIIVIAIMAILGGIIAPQYFKHVNNAKITSDLETADRIASALSVQVADDAALGKTPTVADTGTTWTPISGLATSVISSPGNSKVEKLQVFFYQIDNTTGTAKVAVGLATAPADAVELTPTAPTSTSTGAALKWVKK